MIELGTSERVVLVNTSTGSIPALALDTDEGGSVYVGLDREGLVGWQGQVGHHLHGDGLANGIALDRSCTGVMLRWTGLRCPTWTGLACLGSSSTGQTGKTGIFRGGKRRMGVTGSSWSAILMIF